MIGFSKISGRLMYGLLTVGVLIFHIESKAQESKVEKPSPRVPELKINFNEEGSHFVKFTFANQTWVRYAENNPGSTVGGSHSYQKEDHTFDIGLRRTRMQVIGKPSDRFFFYTQFGMNNFNYISARKSGFFIHDALGEINISKHFEVGAGLTAWTGFSRFSSPSVAGIMALDAPLFLQATNDANDQFLRKLSVYAKGKIGRLDYRLIASKPMDYVYSSLYKKANISTDAMFSPIPPKVQYSGYLSYQFLDQESNLTPYQIGTYLGKKKVFNIGGGFEFQQNAMWYQKVNANGIDTVQHNMMLAAVDVFYDAPLNPEKGNAISVYAVAAMYDFGHNYIRNLGVMNTTDSLIAGQSSFNGTGVSFPMIGSGNSVYMQIGYLSSKLSEEKSLGRLMPYVAVQYSDYEKLNDPMIFVDAGCSWYLDDTRSKLTFGVQNRPVYKTELDAGGNTVVNEFKRLNAFIFQYQVSI